ncbi:MAG TPA: biopolymer transporter ExbD [Telluria sp.]|jgi:biopolymer transport protein ExbD
MRKKLASLLTGNQSTPEPMMEMNMTPLIDVMLVLIIMLIITIPRQQHAIGLGLGSNPIDADMAPAVTIDVDFDGTLSWDGVVVSRATLASKLAALARAPAPEDVRIRPNKLAAYKYVASVMASAHRAGVTGIGIVGNEQFL